MPDPIHSDHNDYAGFLYKYKSIHEKDMGWTRQIFTRNEIFLSPPRAFNDPFDCRFVYSFEGTETEKRQYFDRMVRDNRPQLSRNERRKLSRIWREEFESKRLSGVISAERDKIMDDLGVCSFSKVRNNILMWSHYSDSHRGICLEFAHTFTEHFLGRTQEVQYSEAFPVIRLFHKKKADDAYKAVTTKSIDWSYEREWRLIEEGSGPRKFPKKLLTGVIFGSRTKEEDKELVMDWCKEGSLSPAFYQAEVKNNLYSLKISAVA